MWSAASPICAVALLALVVACSGSSSSSDASDVDGSDATRTSTDAAGVPLSSEEAEALLRAAEPIVPLGEAGSGIDDHLDEPVVLEVARSHLDTGDATWADVYVWANAGDDSAPLVPYLESDDVQIRTIAAIGAAARGEPKGLEVLIEALDDDDTFLDDPPRPVWSMASTYLAVFTGSATLGPPNDATVIQRQDAQQRWRDWLSSSPTFDADRGTWSAPS